MNNLLCEMSAKELEDLYLKATRVPKYVKDDDKRFATAKDILCAMIQSGKFDRAMAKSEILSAYHLADLLIEGEKE